MKSDSVRCEFCKTEIASEPCKFAAYSTTIEGKEYVFCCAQCAKQNKQTKTKNR
jgi:hypothetical protein